MMKSNKTIAVSSGFLMIAVICLSFLLSGASTVNADNSAGNASVPPVVSLPPSNTSSAGANAGSAAPINNTTGAVSGGLVVCSGVKDGSNRPICDFNQLLQEGNKIISWMFVISIPVAVVLVAFGGILYIIGTSKNRNRAKDIFIAAGIGFGIMLIAWVSVYTIVSWLTTGSNTSTTNSTGITTFLGK